MEQNILLQLTHISKRYKTELALKDIGMTLHKGEIFGAVRRRKNNND